MTGETLGGRYLVGAQLGDGGTAAVYRATDLHLGVECAIKVSRRDAGFTEQIRARMRAEAQTMARLSHPNVLRVFGAGSDGELDWIAMELSEAGSLADHVRAHGPLTVRRAIQVVLQVLAALDAAHDAGVVHRDVKPDNVLQHESGAIKLCDFGIALVEDTTRLTQAGFAMGSLPYMAPEQRVDAHQVGPTVDLYATAATLYFLLTGATPVDLFLAPPSSPRFAGMPEGIVELIRRGTHADPAQRFGSPREMTEALEHVLPHVEDRVIGSRNRQVHASGELPETSRVATRVAPDHDPSHALEVQLQRDWLVEEGEARRALARRTGRIWFAVSIALMLLVVAIGGWTTMDAWVEAHEIRHVRLPGEWKGVCGDGHAALRLSEGGAGVRAELVLLEPTPRRLTLEGSVERGVFTLAGGDASLRVEARGEGRLVGELRQAREEALPVHLVRVPASTPVE